MSCTDVAAARSASLSPLADSHNSLRQVIERVPAGHYPANGIPHHSQGEIWKVVCSEYGVDTNAS
jgi:hypothetical protein